MMNMGTDIQGPDKILPTENIFTWKRDCVKLRHFVYNNNNNNNNNNLDNGCDDDAFAPSVSIVTKFRQEAEKYAETIAMVDRGDGSPPHVVTYRDYHHQVIHVAKIFIKLGLEVEHSLGIIGFNSPQWFISHLASIHAGGFSAGIYATNSRAACKFICQDSRCDVVVVEDDNQLRKFINDDGKLSWGIKAIIQYRGKPSVTHPNIYSWNDIMTMKTSDDDDVELGRRINNLAVNKCAVLIYTSGTTGEPKGAMLSHDNILWTAQRMIRHVRHMIHWDASRDTTNDVMVSYLPLSHVAGMMLDLYWPMLCGGGTTYFARPDALKGSLLKTVKETRPTFFFGVPRVWEKMREKMMAQLSANTNPIKNWILNWARDVGMEANSRKPKPLLFGLAKLLVFDKIRVELGLDRSRIFYTGGAPSKKEVLDFFLGFNIPIMELYGLSESSGPHTVNLPDEPNFDSQGKVVPGFLCKFLKVDDDNNHYNHDESKDDDGDDYGEICMNGRQIFMGYLDKEVLTRQAFTEDGWLRSGDLGRMDRDGYLYVTGRLKELLVTDGGENIAPLPIESRVHQRLPCLSNCMLVGDKRKFLSMLITFKTNIDTTTGEPSDTLADDVITWCRSFHSQARTVQDLIATPNTSDVMRAIQHVIDDVNMEATSNAHKIQKWLILPKDFSLGGGELGPTLKLRRKVVTTKYEKLINDLYDVHVVNKL
ncbi:hypothetical protein HELRODRAFT_186206 [Helobdella robusta]|uniref:long-chain-fatty-acid--CoA ligase n=1 Tax=Helobdella robusta TaxID=6412 RepID=T1FNT4_HELRO|nr:hypothetical protein HELRODRAFT_186206 [Helobdella robusta]ESN90834.1 hypothetical protein HELRODRAFT_186206 [Helobdella robusta]